MAQKTPIKPYLSMGESGKRLACIYIRLIRVKTKREIMPGIKNLSENQKKNSYHQIKSETSGKKGNKDEDTYLVRVN